MFTFEIEIKRALKRVASTYHRLSRLLDDGTASNYDIKKAKGEYIKALKNAAAVIAEYKEFRLENEERAETLKNLAKLQLNIAYQYIEAMTSTTTYPLDRLDRKMKASCINALSELEASIPDQINPTFEDKVYNQVRKGLKL